MIITSSFGIIIRARISVKARFLPGKSSLANAKAAGIITINMIAVVAREKITVLKKYAPRGISENAETKFSNVGLKVYNFVIVSPLYDP